MANVEEEVADFDDGNAEFDTEPQPAAAEGAPLTVVETVEVVQASEPAPTEPVAGAHTVVETVTVQDDAGNTATVVSETPAEGGQQIPTDSGTANADGSVEDPMSLPPHGTEVFFGGIPRAATEAQLIEFASAAGEVFSATLLRDQAMPSQNKGCGFVRYAVVESANKAKDPNGGLHNEEMKDYPGQKLRVAPSQAKNKLFIGNIPKGYDEAEVTRQLNQHVKGVEGIDLLMSKDFPGQNRGFAFVAFYNHACANAAKNILSAPTFRMGERPLTVSFAEPKQSEMAPQTAQDKVLYVGNLPESGTEEMVRDLFSGFGEVTAVVHPPPRDGKRRDYCFVHFADHAVVQKLIADGASGNKPQLEGTALDMKPARPQTTPDQRGFGGRGGQGGFGAPYGRGGRGGFQSRGRGPQGRGGYGRGDYGQGYGQGYGEGYGGYGGGYDEGYGAQSGAYGAYGDYSGYGASAAYGGQGMAMVPMMLPSGQVGYVLQGSQGGGASGYGAQRSYDQGQGSNYSQRYRPY
ncbi:hypothetical protein WJX73_004990 [Symbiochloris irregularis]|uniref:RRM domain-containing protein n=1 Tax=Symbiochloris irregularis TaxID=706552 RepID=A0AAW1PDN3_9CHLO